MAEPSKAAMAIAWDVYPRKPEGYIDRRVERRKLAEAIDAHAAEMVAEERRRWRAWVANIIPEEILSTNRLGRMAGGGGPWIEGNSGRSVWAPLVSSSSDWSTTTT
jgi:hypothetical protein